MRNLAFAAGFVLAGALAQGAVAAEPANPLPPAKRDGYVSPKIDDEYANALKKLPDWNGAWIMQAAPKKRPSQLMFDPEHFFEPKYEGDPSPTGPIVGSYLTEIPYKPEYRKKYMDNVASAVAGRSVDKVAGACLPYGMLRLMGGAPSGPEITVTPEMVIMYFDIGSQVRHIYTDGRRHPQPDEFTGKLRPRWNGHSVGRWEGDTLVVDTVGLIPAFYDQTSPPYSDEVHVVERIRLIAWNWLEDEMTIEDPVMLTRPWTVTRTYRRSASAKYPSASDDTCLPDDFVDVSAGYQRVILPSERERAAPAKSRRPRPKQAQGTAR